MVPGGPSEQGGVQGAEDAASAGNNSIQSGGDIVIAIDGNRVTRFEELVSYLVTKASPGQTVTLTVVRGGQEVDLEVTLGVRPGSTLSTTATIEGPVSARQAIRIAEEAAGDTLESEITERTSSPDVLGGQEVWVVELRTSDQQATVIVSQTTGEVLELSITE